MNTHYNLHLIISFQNLTAFISSSLYVLNEKNNDNTQETAKIEKCVFIQKRRFPFEAVCVYESFYIR